MMFPFNSPVRIPIIAITGTNGKTTVARLIAHIVKLAGKKVGLATTEGIYVDNELVYQGDCSGPKSAQDILRDPLVDFAVLECARGGIARSGLGFDKCDTSIVTNISDDHLGMDDTFTIEDLINIKSVVPHSTVRNGYAILNSEDNHVYQMKFGLHCKAALFGLTFNEIIKEHSARGKLACFIQDEYIFISENTDLIKLIHVNEVPITLNGTLSCMVANILPAILTCYIHQIKSEEIIRGLKTFTLSAEHLPGRYNLFQINGSKILLDYAHNENAYVFLKKYMSKINAKKKVCVIAGTGDRRDIDIENTGLYAAQIFEEIIIRQDKDSRGRLPEEITALILKGIEKAKTKSPSVKIIPDEFEAISYAIANSPKDSFIWYFPDNILNAVNFIKRFNKLQSFPSNESILYAS